MSLLQPNNDGPQLESVEEKKMPVSLIEGLLLCQICYMNFNETTRAARQLHCGHTFCTQCIKSVQKYGNSAHLECPTCRGETKCQLQKLTPNYLVMEIIRKMGLMGASEAVAAPEASAPIRRRPGDKSRETIQEMVDEAYRQLIASVKSDLMYKFEELRINLRGLPVRVAERELDQLKDEVEKAVRDAYSRGFSEEEDDDLSSESSDSSFFETMRNGNEEDREIIVENPLNETESSDISFEDSNETSDDSTSSDSSYTSGHSD